MVFSSIIFMHAEKWDASEDEMCVAEKAYGCL